MDSCFAVFAIDTNAPMCIFVGECSPLEYFRPTILASRQHIRAWIGKLVQVDVVSIGTRAH